MEGREVGRKYRLVDGFRARLVWKSESDFNSKLWKQSGSWNPYRNFTYPVNFFTNTLWWGCFKHWGYFTEQDRNVWTQRFYSGGVRSKKRLPRWLSGKESTCQCRRCRRHGFSPLVGKLPWSRKWQPTPVFLPEKFHGQRSTVYGVAKSQTWLSMHTDTRSIEQLM